MGRKGHPETIPAGQASQILTLLSQPAPPLTIPKTLAAQAPVFPAPRRRSPPLPRHPEPSRLPYAVCGVCAEVGWGLGAGIPGPRKCTCDLGLEKVAPRSPTPRLRGGGGGSRRPDSPFWVPETLSLRQERLAGFSRTGTRWSSSPSFCILKSEGNGPTKAKGEEQRMRLAESPRKGRPAPGWPRQKRGEQSFPGRSRLGIWCPVPPGDKVALLVALPRRVPLASQALRAGRGVLPSWKCRRRKRGANFVAFFRAGFAPRVKNVAAVGPQRGPFAFAWVLNSSLHPRVRTGLRAAGGLFHAHSGRGCPGGSGGGWEATRCLSPGLAGPGSIQQRGSQHHPQTGCGLRALWDAH